MVEGGVSYLGLVLGCNHLLAPHVPDIGLAGGGKGCFDSIRQGWRVTIYFAPRAQDRSCRRWKGCFDKRVGVQPSTTVHRAQHWSCRRWKGCFDKRVGGGVCSINLHIFSAAPAASVGSTPRPPPTSPGPRTRTRQNPGRPSPRNASRDLSSTPTSGGTTDWTGTGGGPGRGLNPRHSFIFFIFFIFRFFRIPIFSVSVFHFPFPFAFVSIFPFNVGDRKNPRSHVQKITAHNNKVLYFTHTYTHTRVYE